MNRRINVDTLAVVALLAIFLCTAAALLLFGLKSYQQTQSDMEHTFQESTPLSYIASKARQHDGLHLSTFDDGTPALLMESEYYGELFTTWIYYLDGSLYEMFTPADVVLEPQDGIQLISTPAITFSQEGALIAVSFAEDEGLSGQLLLSPRTPSKEVFP